MVCFRYVIVNTLHTGENKDNNNNNVAGYIHWMICKHTGYRLLTSTMNTFLKGS